jgi:hypothetical protein
MKRDPALMFLPQLILFSAAIGLFLPGQPEAAAMVCGVVGFAGALACRPHERATSFEATLPIAGRQLFLARMSLIMAIIWLPALFGGAAILISRSLAKEVLTVAAMAAIATLAVMALQSVRVQLLCSPHSLLLVFFPVMVFIVAFTALSDFVAPAPALMVCLPLSAALFLRTWRAIPKGLLIAPEAVAVRPTRGHAGGEPVVPWLAILRSAFPWGIGAFSPVLFWSAMTGSLVFVCCIGVNIMWMASRPRVRWACVLPVSPRVVLSLVIGPVLVVTAGGYLAGRRYHAVEDPRFLILHVAAIIGLTLLFVLFNALFDWRRLRHVRLAVRVGLFSPMFPVLAIVVCGFCHVELATFLPGVSRALPGNLAAAVAVAGIALAALYWAVERVFAEAEYA